MEHSIFKRCDVSECGEGREISGLVSGKRILLAALIAASLVPVITWFTLRQVEAKLAVDQPPLSWAERAQWPSPPIKRVSLERPQSMYGGRASTSKWRSYDFEYRVPAIMILAEQLEKKLDEADSEPQREAIRASLGAQLAAKIADLEAAVAQCAALARQADGAGSAEGAAARSFADEAVRDRLLTIADEWPGFFYPPYLLGTWHRVNGEPAEADRYYEQAFALAPAVIELRYVDPGDAPMAGLELGTAEITCDRVIDGELDQTLKLAYPRLVTDERGTVYLPAFHAVYRATQVPRPQGYAAQFELEGWFQFPGRIGSPKPIMIWKQPGSRRDG